MARIFHGGPILLLRWVLLFVLLLALRELAGVGAPQIGDICCLQPSTLSIALFGLGVSLFTLSAVTYRGTRPTSIPLAVFETLVVASLVAWRSVEVQLHFLFKDWEFLEYRIFLGIWLAGAILGLAGSIRNRRQAVEEAERPNHQPSTGTR